MMTLPFDRVVLIDGGKRRHLPAREFLAIPLPEKIQFILSRSIEFYEGTTPVERKVALASLRDSRSG